ncbi:MAG: TerC family protein [Chloroflexi bacterium]|nr:TerC family protein [Chloroflexota bacterium]MXY00216.1 TerC family protein [Chloroflexota bacterium]MYB16662.1 TerC family protein [Chloroflexota bacterium]
MLATGRCPDRFAVPGSEPGRTQHRFPRLRGPLALPFAPSVDGELLGSILQIIVIDLVLSGDNAILIGVVASSLSGSERRNAIIIGAGTATVLRVGLAAVATQLLALPFLAAAGGLALFWVGWRLLTMDKSDHSGGRKAGSFRQAIGLILLADVVMSLDNILSVAGAAHGNVGLLIFGLALSIPLLFVGSGLIAHFTGRFPILIYIGAAVIFRIGVVLIVEDSAVHDFLGQNFFLEVLLPWIAAFAGPLLYVAVSKIRNRPVNPLWVSRD